MFDDGDARFGQFGDQLEGGIGIVDVIVRKLFALHLLGRRHAGAGVTRGIESRLLVRVFAVAQRLLQRAAEGELARGGFRHLTVEPGGNTGIIGPRAGEGAGGERAAEGKVGAPGVGQRGDHLGIIGGIGDDGHGGVVLRGGADHRRAANVDILDAGIEIGAFGDGRLEGIERHHHYIDGADAVFLHGGLMAAAVAAPQQPAVDFRVQGFYPPIHHFREASVIGHVRHRQTGGAQRIGGTAGREQFGPGAVQGAAKLDNPGFVVDRQQGAGGFHQIGQRQIAGNMGGHGNS